MSMNKKSVIKSYAIIIISLLFLIVSCDDNTLTPVCGNGQIDEGEECDPAMDITQGTCSDDCKILQFCGNGLIEGNEECDDGNLGNYDGCSRSCQIETGCGNGFIDISVDELGRPVFEECDDDNIKDGDGCSSTCMLESGSQTCGNGLLEFPEDCDDGNTTAGDGCSDTCTIETGCGDGLRDVLTEECDDGNSINGDGCTGNCLVEFICGDGICDEDNNESCEVCPQDCCPDCGDGMLDDGEECDDGNRVRFDGCSSGCHDEDSVATCGNSIWEVGEECDDGNLETGDGCDATCLREFIIDDSNCEWEKGETCRLSPNDCCPNCGDDTIDANEKCDGANLGNKSCTDLCYDGGTLGCTDWCEYDFSQCTGTGPICGDNTAECAEECDGSDLKGKSCQSFGFAEGTLECTSGCKYNATGCSGFMHYIMANFDDGNIPMGWSINGTIWALGAPTNGPGSAFSTPNVIATSLTGEYVDSMDYNSNNVTLPSIDLSNGTAPILTFRSWMNAESCCDGGRVEVSIDGGSSWNPVPDAAVTPAFDNTSSHRWTGDHSSWAEYTVDLSSYIGQVSVKVRFAFYSDSSISHEGWYIDDVLITEAGI